MQMHCKSKHPKRTARAVEPLFTFYGKAKQEATPKEPPRGRGLQEKFVTLLFLNVERPPQAVVITLYALCMVVVVETPTRLLNDRGHLSRGLFIS